MNKAEELALKVKEKGGRAFYVGGYVRDFLMHKENKDIDIEVHGLDENVLYGIRPEKMTRSDGDIKLTVDVEISEMLGSEKIAYFNIGNRKYSARLDADVQIGKKLGISIKSSEMYKFDMATGMRVQ